MILLLRIIASIAILFLAAIVLSSLVEMTITRDKQLALTEVLGNTVACIISSAWIIFLLYVLEKLQ